MVKIPPKLPVFVCFVVSAGRRESISRLEEIAAGFDDDSARNASHPKWWRPRPVSGKNWILLISDVSPSKLNFFLSFPFTERVCERPIVAQRNEHSCSKALQYLQASCVWQWNETECCILVSCCPFPSFFSPARRRGVPMWLFSPRSVTPEPEKKLFCLAASSFSPSTPPPTPPSSLLHPLHLLRSWPSYAPGAASTSWSCSTSGPHITPWTLTGQQACPQRECLSPARGWTALVPWLCMRWRWNRMKPSSSSCLRQGASLRNVRRTSHCLFFLWQNDHCPR